MNGNDAWSAVAELAASQHGVFHRKQAAENNLNAQHLRRAVTAGRIRLASADVFAFPSAKSTWWQRHMIASLRGAVASHRSAAAMHGLDGFEAPRHSIEVCFRRDSVSELTGLDSVVVHTWRRTDASDITLVQGVRCTSIARTLVQLGAVCSRATVEAALESALRRGISPEWIEQTWQRLLRPGHTGANVLQSIMSDPARSGVLSESVFELLVERVLRDARLPSPQRQFEIALASGPRRVDLAYPDARLAIEAHSRTFHFGRAMVESDNIRDLELAAAGWEVLYITWSMAKEPEFFIELLRRTYLQRIDQSQAS